MELQTAGFEVKRVIRLHGDGTVKAFCDVAVGNFVIKGVRVVDGRKGLFVSMPRQLGKDGKWYEDVVATSKDTEDTLFKAVMTAYEAEAVGV